MALIQLIDNDSDDSMDISDEEDYQITTFSGPDKRLLLVTSVVVLDWVMNSRICCGSELPFDTAIYRLSEVESMGEEESEENKVPENSVCYKAVSKRWKIL